MSVVVVPELRFTRPVTSQWMLLLFAARLLCVTAVAADSDSASAPPLVWKSGTHRLTFDGRDRTFILDVPSKLKSGAPLVMIFHGFTSSAKEVRDLTGFTKLSEEHGFVAVYPDGTRDSKGSLSLMSATNFIGISRSMTSSLSAVWPRGWRAISDWIHALCSPRASPMEAT